MDGTCTVIELLQCDVIHGIVIRLTSDLIHGSFVQLIKFNALFMADLIHELTAINICCFATMYCNQLDFDYGSQQSTRTECNMHLILLSV